MKPGRSVPLSSSLWITMLATPFYSETTLNDSIFALGYWTSESPDIDTKGCILRDELNRREHKNEARTLNNTGWTPSLFVGRGLSGFRRAPAKTPDFNVRVISSACHQVLQDAVLWGLVLPTHALKRMCKDEWWKICVSVCFNLAKRYTRRFSAVWFSGGSCFFGII